MTDARGSLMSSNLVVIGTGLIGSSLAMSAKRRSLFDTVWAVNRSESTNEQALAMGVADKAATHAQIDEVLSSLNVADVVVIAVPVRTYQSIFEKIKPSLPVGVVVTDVGSTKASVIESAKTVWGEIPTFFVPGHPIAGSERSGVQAANPELFVDRRFIITPVSHTSEEAAERVKSLWTAVGSVVDEMNPDHHDAVLAATSHLPHVLAYAIVDALVTLEQKTEVFRYAAGGFSDFTRIAESDPVMWRDILLANKSAILDQLDNFETHLADLRGAIERSDGEAIEQVLERSRDARQLFSQAKLPPQQ